MIGNEVEHLNGTSHPTYNNNTWSSSSQQQERSNSFDEFVNSEVAVAMAMVDDSYLEKLSDAQRKRVERLKAYQKCSEDSTEQPEALQDRRPNESNTHSPQLLFNPNPSVAQTVVRHKARELQSAGKVKSLIPVRTNTKPGQVHGLLRRGLKSETVKAEGALDSLQTPRLVREHVRVEQDVGVQLHNGSKQRLSKPPHHQKEQWKTKEHHGVQKQQTKNCRQIEQAVLALEGSHGADDETRLPLTKNSLKNGEIPMERANGLLVHKTMGNSSSEHVLRTDTIPLSSGRAEARLEARDVTNEWTHAQREESKQEGKTRSKVKKKILKFASTVSSPNTTSNLHDPIQQLSTTKPHGIVNHSIEQSSQGQHSTKLAPLKKSSATTMLTLEWGDKDEIQSQSTSLLHQRQQPWHQKPHSRLINAAARTDNSNSCNSSPERSVYAGAQSSPQHSTKSMSQRGGYSVAYAKRRETNRKRIIRVSGV